MHGYRHKVSQWYKNLFAVIFTFIYLGICSSMIKHFLSRYSLFMRPAPICGSFRPRESTSIELKSQQSQQTIQTAIYNNAHHWDPCMHSRVYFHAGNGNLLRISCIHLAERYCYVNWNAVYGTMMYSRGYSHSECKWFTMLIASQCANKRGTANSRGPCSHLMESLKILQKCLQRNILSRIIIWDWKSSSWEKLLVCAHLSTFV